MSSSLASYAQINPRVSPSDVLVFGMQDPRYAGVTYVAVDSYCVQTSCPCRLVALRIERLPESPADRDPHPEQFFMHLDSLELYDVDNSPLDTERHPLAYAARAELPPEALEMWRSHYEEGRRYGEQHGWRHRRWDDLAPGDMIAYHDVWDSEPILFAEGSQGVGLAVIERYCPSPICDCQEVLLSIVPATEGQALTEENESLVRLSFNGRFGVEDAGPQSKEQVQQHVRALLNSPGSLKTFKDHYKAIKKVGAELAKRYPELAKGWGMRASEPSQDTSGAAPKVGRNDPCTCGSGRKYKQCCGRA